VLMYTLLPGVVFERLPGMALKRAGALAGCGGLGQDR
jgi:hypothetical protein